MAKLSDFNQSDWVCDSGVANLNLMGLRKFFEVGKLEAGCDEAGRGCLAGPVVAAAVVLPSNFRNPGLNDSKKLTAPKRVKLAQKIKKMAIAYAIAEVDNQEIDRINILKASFKAMHKAIDGLTVRPELLLIDGNAFPPYPEIPHECIVKGDGKFCSIAAASILAKTYRDELMARLALEHTHYQWESNVGYPTEAHREGIRQYGITQYHRKSFQLLTAQLELFEDI